METYAPPLRAAPTSLHLPTVLTPLTCRPPFLNRPEDVEVTMVPVPGLHSVSVDAGRGVRRWALWVVREGRLMKLGVKGLEMCREGLGGGKMAAESDSCGFQSSICPFLNVGPA